MISESSEKSDKFFIFSALKTTNCVCICAGVLRRKEAPLSKTGENWSQFQKQMLRDSFCLVRLLFLFVYLFVSVLFCLFNCFGVLLQVTPVYFETFKSSTSAISGVNIALFETRCRLVVYH